MSAFVLYSSPVKHSGMSSNTQPPKPVNLSSHDQNFVQTVIHQFYFEKFTENINSEDESVDNNAVTEKGNLTRKRKFKTLEEQSSVQELQQQGRFVSSPRKTENNRINTS